MGIIRELDKKFPMYFYTIYTIDMYLDIILLALSLRI